MIDKIVIETENIGKKVSCLGSLVNKHIWAVIEYRQRLVVEGVEFDENRIREYVKKIIGNLIGNLEKEIDFLADKVSEEISKRNAWISEYESSGGFLKEDFERALSKLYEEKEILEERSRYLERLRYSIESIKDRYQMFF